MSETLEEVDEIAKTIPEVAPPGWGHTVAKKEKTKPNKPKSKIGGSAHEFQKDLDSGKFKGLPGDKTKADKKASMFKLMWSMKNKGDKPHYKPGVKDKLKSQYKEEVETEGFFSGKTKGRVTKSIFNDPAFRKITGRKSLADIAKKKKEQETKKESKLPPHLSKFLDKEGNPNPEAAKRMAVGRKKREAPKVKDVTPKGYGPKEEVEMEGRFASAASDPRIGGSSSVDTVPDFTWKAKKGAISAPGSGSIAKAKKAKASDVNKSIEQQMKDAMKEDTWSKNFKKQAAKRLGQRRREQQAGEVGQKAKPRPQEESHDCNEIHPDKTHSKWLKTQNEDWTSIKEAQWKVKLKGLPTFYVPGKSAGAIRQMLRKQLKRPMDDIEDVTRATPAAKKKDFRDRAQGQEDSAVVSGKG